MSDGIEVEHNNRGVRITARAKGGVVRLTVTREYARALAAELLGGWDAPVERPQDFARELIEQLKRSRR